jgi:hypothetical protein
MGEAAGNPDVYKKTAGSLYERKFIDYLNGRGIPFLYIDQELEGKEEGGRSRSAIFKNSDIKRPDFLVYLWQTEKQMFIDVKARTKWELKGADKRELFYLTAGEIEALNNLQWCIRLPVWIAFAEIKKEEEEGDFYFAPISALKNLKDKIIKKYKVSREMERGFYILAPESFCCKMDGNFFVANSAYNYTISEEEGAYYSGQIERKAKEKSDGSGKRKTG